MDRLTDALMAMMRHTVFLAGVSLLVTTLAGTGSAWGQPSADATHAVTTPEQLPTDGQLAESLSDLSAESAARRGAAVEALLAASPDLLPRLPNPDELPTAAARRALEQIRLALEHKLAERVTTASRVTVVAATDVGGLLEEITRQTGNRLALEPSALGFPIPFEVTAGPRPFWELVGDLESGLENRLVWRDDGGYTFTPREAEQRSHVSLAGPARLLLDRPQVRPLNDARTEFLVRCEPRLQLEPRWEPLFAQLKTADWVAGGSAAMMAWNPAADYELAIPEGRRELVLPLDWRAARLPDKPWSLRGRVTVHFAAGREPFTFRGRTLIPGQKQRRGQVTLRLQQARFEPTPQGLTAVVRILVHYEQGGPAFESHRVGLFHRAAWLIDAQDQRRPPAEYQVLAEADGGISLEYRFTDLPGKPVDYGFVYEAPMLLLAVPLDFTLKELPPLAAPSAR